jgi:hypothetical protein
MLYENTKDANERILDTIYIFIGTMATIMLAFIGINVFYNNKSRKNDSDNMLNQFSTKLNEIQEKALLEIKDKLEVIINEKINEINRNYQLYNDNHNQKLDATNNEISILDKKLHKLIDSKIDIINNQVTLIKSENEKQHMIFTADYLKISAEKWLEKNVLTNALRNYCDSIIIRLENSLPLVDNHIKEVIVILEKLNALDSYDRSYVNKVILSLKHEQYFLYKDKLIEHRITLLCSRRLTTLSPKGGRDAVRWCRCVC